MSNNTEIVELLNSMTLKEKAAQLLQLAPLFFNTETKGEITGPLEDLEIDEEDVWMAGDDRRGAGEACHPGAIEQG